jgi:hypothetical protein
MTWKRDCGLGTPFITRERKPRELQSTAKEGMKMKRCGVMLSRVVVLVAMSGLIPSFGQDSLNMVARLETSWNTVNCIAVSGD